MTESDGFFGWVWRGFAIAFGFQILSFLQDIGHAIGFQFGGWIVRSLL